MRRKLYRARDLVGTQASRRKGEVGILPFSPALLWRLTKAGRFPKPLHLSDGVTVWRGEDIDQWLVEHGLEPLGEDRSQAAA